MRRLACKVKLIGLATGFLVATIGLCAQQDLATQPESVLDRIVPPTSPDAPFMLTPPLPWLWDEAPWAIGRATGIVVGFEGAPEVVWGPITPERQQQLKHLTRVPLAGKTVRAAFDAIVANDPRYHWVDVHGTPVVRPVRAWVDPRNPLNQTVVDVNWDEITLWDSLSRVKRLIFPNLLAAEHPHGERISVRLRSGSVLDVLNEIAHARGKTGWRVLYGCGSKWTERPTIYIELRGYEHGGIGSCAPEPKRC
jgi:hypothetical protein